MKKMLIIVLGSCFIAAPIVASVPPENAKQEAKATACKCDSACCNPCGCSTPDACKAKAQKAESAAVAQAAVTKETTKCCSSTK